jgi:hypothetical protein
MKEGFSAESPRAAKFADRDIHCVVEVPKTVFRPDTGMQFLASDQVSRVLQQNLQYLEGLVLELDAASGLADLSGGEIGFKRPKAYRPVPVIQRDVPVLRKV